MDFFSTQFLSALFAIVIIDLVLAGDNAIVIALAARSLPTHLRKKAVFWGTFAAIAVRSVMTIIFVWLLTFPGLLLIGGVLLIWIGYKLLVADDESSHQINPTANFWRAVRTIVFADVIMGVDNVLAVAGAAEGSYILVVLGLLISIPIVVWGSTFILHYIDRFPIIVYIGAGVIAWTAAKMIVAEPLVKDYFANKLVAWGLYIVVTVGVLAAGYYRNRKNNKSS